MKPSLFSLFLATLTTWAIDIPQEKEYKLPFLENQTYSDAVIISYELEKTQPRFNGWFSYLMPTLSDSPILDPNFTEVYYSRAILQVSETRLSADLETETIWACMWQICESGEMGPCLISISPDARGVNLFIGIMARFTITAWK